MSDQPLKSAYELAMEKLRARDKEKGVEESKSLTEEQKARIAEARSQAKAKLAEIEILWQSKRRSLAHDPEALEKAEQEYVADRARVEERAETEIARLRRG